MGPTEEKNLEKKSWNILMIVSTPTHKSRIYFLYPLGSSEERRILFV